MDNKLTQERLKELLHYDPETGVFTRRVTVSNGRFKAGSVAGTVGSKGEVKVTLDRRAYSAAKLAWMYTCGTYPAGLVKPLNGDSSDYRARNLYLAGSPPKLTAERLRELVSYNPVSGELVWLRTVSSTAVAGKPVGKLDISHGYLRRTVDCVRYAEHRLVWLYMTGEWPESQIDHVNGDRKDNRWENLREATDSENRQNMARRSNGSSRFPGVRWFKRDQRWAAAITKDYKQKHLGYFDSEEAAFSAYCAAKAELHTFNPTPRSENAS